MKRLFLAVMLFVSSFSVMASNFDASVGADTNFVFRGQTLSERGLSAKFDVKGTLDNGLYAAYDLHTASVVNTKINALHVIEGGYGTQWDGVGVATGYTYYKYTGGSVPVKSSDSNFGEVFAAASAFGLNAKYAQRVNHPTGNTGNDSYFRLAYTHVFDCAAAVTGGYENSRFKTAHVTSQNYDLGVSYPVTSKVNVNAVYTYAGNGVNSVKRPNQVSAGVNYKF